MDKNTIAFIIPYFGALPNYYNLWESSVRFNKSIDFLLFTDQKITNPPDNLHVISTKFDEIVQKINKHFDFQVNIPFPYKLCDFRPAFGEIFQTYLHGYTFWGHCDLDQIWGNIRRFITEDVLSNHDRIFLRGHCTLYRNNTEVNSIYKSITPSYREVFSNYIGYFYDETPCSGAFWMSHRKDKTYDAFVFDDLNCLEFGFIDVHKKDLEKHRSHFSYIFEKGELYRCYLQNNEVCKEATMYAHFQKRELSIDKSIDKSLESFMIIPNRFIPIPQPINSTFLRQNCIDQIKAYKLYRFCMNKYKSRIREIKYRLIHL